MNPTRRWFVKVFSGAILTTLLGVKAWRLEDAEVVEISGSVDYFAPGDTLTQWHIGPDMITVPEAFARRIRENVRGESPFAPIIRAAGSEP